MAAKRKKSAKKPPEHNKLGRPLIVATEAQLATIEAGIARGLTEEQIARLVFQCDPTTFTAMKKRDPRIIPALIAGVAKGQEITGALLFDLCKSADSDAVRLAAIRWWEATRNRKSDRITVGTPEQMTRERVQWHLGEDDDGNPMIVTF